LSLGYKDKLYILAFDHRGSFQKKMFGIDAAPTVEESRSIADAKLVIYEGVERAVDLGVVPAARIGVLVDEQFGAPSDIPARAKARGLRLAMPVEKSGQDEFDFEYGDEFAGHIEKFDPDFCKVLVRYNPDADATGNELQLQRLKRLSDWLLSQSDNPKFLFELLVPPTEAQLTKAHGNVDRYDADLRPELMCRAIDAFQRAAIEVDVWKIEGVDYRDDAQMLAKQTRRLGRADVACVLLGRGAGDEKVDEWLRQAAPVQGFAGFAIGRSIWWDALKAYLDGTLERESAAQRIAESYVRFIRVYEEAERSAMV
jgi:5-dehydro-2-deoxygluconokinase